MKSKSSFIVVGLFFKKINETFFMSQLKSIAITIHPLNFLLNESLSQTKKERRSMTLKV